MIAHHPGSRYRSAAEEERHGRAWVCRPGSAAGRGSTPLLAKKFRDFLPEEDLLSYTTAIVASLQPAWHAENHKYKERIKILVHETGVEELTRQDRGRFRASEDGEL